MDNTEAIPLVVGETVTTTRGASELDWSNLQRDYERLGSFKAIATEYGVDPSIVSRKASEMGVESVRRWRKRNFTPEKLLKLYEDGKSIEEIAEIIRGSYSTAYSMLRSAGVTFNPGNKGWKWTEAEYEKRRAATERGAFKGAQRERFRRIGETASKVSSPHEKLLHQALIKAKLSFETQSREINRYWPDVKLHQRPILVEVDGWAHRMASKQEFDIKRDAALTAAGFTVVRFTNEQVEENADDCVAQLMREHDLQPEENPTVLIRDKRSYE